MPSPKKDVHGEVLPEEEGWFTYEGPAAYGDSAVPRTTTPDTVVGKEGGETKMEPDGCAPVSFS